MNTRIRTALATILVTTAMTGVSAHAGEVASNIVGGVFNMKVTSIKEARFRKVVKQQYDFSCGAAAVATMLTYHYERPTNEAEVFAAMFNAGDQEKIKKEGFSLLDMKTYLESKGYKANGYRVSLDKLSSAKIPAIALINIRGYLHFVVIKGVTKEQVLVADPAFGNKVYPRATFEQMWQKIVFVILNDNQIASRHFNKADEWQVKQKAPMGTALMRDGITYFSLMLPGRNYF